MAGQTLLGFVNNGRVDTVGICRQWQGRQWQDTFLYSCSNTFCIIVSFVNNGQVQLFWLLLYQMPYIY